jgi:hypothetical protein
MTPCAKCQRLVGSLHNHWGLADFLCHPITGQWQCAHCRRLLKNNHKDCRCKK